MNVRIEVGPYTFHGEIGLWRRREVRKARYQNGGEVEGVPEEPRTGAGRRRISWRLERALDHDAVRLRAEALLNAGLDDVQRASLHELGFFTITGSLGNLYRIFRKPVDNVEMVAPDGSVRRTMCAGPRDVPLADAMLAQKLALESDELAFACVANCRVPDLGDPGERALYEPGYGGDDEAEAQAPAGGLVTTGLTRPG